MSPILLLLISVGFLWIIAVIVLVLHRLSPRTGLTPMMVFLGGVAAALEFQGLGQIDNLFGDLSLNLDALILLPTLLFGILIIYIVNGTVRARSAYLGVILIAGLSISFQILMQYLIGAQGFDVISAASIYSLRALVASLVALTFDVLVLFLVYQAWSNYRDQHPSLLAGGMALLLALFVDAVIFPVLAYGLTINLRAILSFHIAGKLVAGLALWPLLVFYLMRITPTLPDTAATSPRPVFDLFTTTPQLESRARYSYNLLRTVSQINQLIIRVNDVQELLQKTCQALIERREYQLVWISLKDKNTNLVSLRAFAGLSLDEKDAFFQSQDSGPWQIVVTTGEAVVVQNVSTEMRFGSAWQEAVLATGSQTVGSFPLRYSNRTQGVLSVCMKRASALDTVEYDLLQELADDLAYALDSLNARSQQSLLQISAETMRDGLLILSTQGEIIYANPVIAEFVGIEQDQLIGKNIETLLLPHQIDTLPMAYETLLETGALAFDLEYQPPESKALVISVNASLSRDEYGEPNQIIANIRDVTAQRRYEHRLLTLHRLTTDLVQIHDPVILPHMILKISEDLLNAVASGIYLVDPDTHQVIDTLTRNLPEAYSQRIASDYRGLPGETVLQTLQPVFVNDTLDDSSYGKRIHFMAEHGVRALLILPMILRETIIGALAIYFRTPHTFTDSDVQIGLTLAQTLAIVYQNARLYQAEQNQRELAEAFAQAAAAVSSSLELDTVLDHILEQTMRVVPCQAVNIMTIDNTVAHIIRHRGYEAYLDDTSGLRSLELDTSWPVLQSMYSEEKPILISDTSDDSRWIEVAETHWVRSFIGIPLKVDQQIVGFLNIDSDQPNFLNQQHLHRLQAFANYASTAIKNARAYENSRRRAEEMASLVTAASAVSKSLDFMQVLKVVAEQMIKTLQVKACLISDYDPEANLLTLLLEYSLDDWKVSPKWYQPSNLKDYPSTRQVLEDNEPLHMRIDDPSLHQAERDFMRDAQIESLLMLPLVSQDRTIGLVELIENNKERDFSVRDIALGLSLASHAASAIENADFYRRLQEHASGLEARVQRRTQELQAAMEYIQGILASVPDAVFVLNSNHQVIRANQAGEKLLARAQQNDLELFKPELLEVLKTEEIPNIDSIFEVQNRAYQALSSQFTADDGQPGGQVIVFRDVTRFHELDQMKTQFVSDVSHELRTPLTNLTLYLGLLSTAQDESKRENYLLTLQRETERLTHLIEDLLTISRLEASRINIQIRAINVNKIVEELVCDRMVLAAQQNIHLTYTLADDLPQAAVDKNLLVQMLSNLLTNATNYTLSGGTVHISTAYYAEDTGDWVAIAISDTGVGISPDELERVFDRFYRGNASQQTGAQGTGLGLAISQEIVTRLDGKITLESSPGEGSTFTVWLKLASDDML